MIDLRTLRMSKVESGCVIKMTIIFRSISLISKGLSFNV